jgi:hypothetical protein
MGSPGETPEAPAPPPPDARRPEYEFGPEENRIIADLGAKMQFVGSLTTLLGGAIVLYGIISVVTSGAAPSPDVLILIGEGFLFSVIGLWTGRAGGEFRLIAQTQGRDMSHLLVALANLRMLYGLQYWLALFGLIFFVVVIVFGVLVRMAW